MITVDAALAHITDLLHPLNIETISLRQARGRVLARDVTASRDQPPFAASAMDGYAVIGAEVSPGKRVEIIGEAAAGGHFDGIVISGQCVRIFTGAPMPTGTDHVIIQENVTRVENTITLTAEANQNPYVRPAGGDFAKGKVMTAPLLLSANDVALLASMNIAEVPVFRRPEVALVATGDELVMPGEEPNADQIIASNNFGLAALLEQHGARVRMLPIARDNVASLRAVFELCDGADLIVTIGGASVGDHDIVRAVAGDMGLKTSFYKVAMRPGKPLMAGSLNGTPMIGLPGNPVSSMVCGHIFLLPALRTMTGFGGDACPRELVRLGQDMEQNGPREHYMRAGIHVENGQLTVYPADRQDSSLLSVLSDANGLLVRAPADPAKNCGDMVEVIRF